MWAALREVGRTLGSEIRVVVVRAEGRAFSAGLDRRLFSADAEEGLTAVAARPTEQGDAQIAEYQQAFSWLRDPDRVTIAAVQGHAIGAGFQLALACDLRILAEDATLRMAEPSLGLVPDLGGTLPLVRTVGYSRAVEICLTSREVSSGEAERMGLANAVVPAGELPTAVDRLVETLLSVPEGAARETLGLLFQADAAVDPEQQLAAERAAQLRRLADLAGRPSG
jgi:enoyl-CoA hydratase/carnithine racemase